MNLGVAASAPGKTDRQQGSEQTQPFYLVSCGAETSRAEIFRARNDGISNHEFQEAQRLVGFPVQVFHLKLTQSGEGPVEELKMNFRIDSYRG